MLPIGLGEELLKILKLKCFKERCLDNFTTPVVIYATMVCITLNNPNYCNIKTSPRLINFTFIV